MVSVPVPYLISGAIADRSVGEERCIWHRVVVGKAELQDRGLREVAGDVIEREHAAAERADGKHVDCRIVRQAR